MDFYRIVEKPAKNGVVEIFADFTIVRSKDLMVRGKQFYAIWDEEKGLWSTDEYDVQRLMDKELFAHKDEMMRKNTGLAYQVRSLGSFGSASWLSYRNYIGHLTDSYHILDSKLTFSNTVVKKTDYVSKRLPYPLASGDFSSYDELVGTLYDPEERSKLEWAIGAVMAGEAKNIQKFMVLYGKGGTGKSTVLNILQQLVDGYFAMFEAQALTSTNNQFGTEAFKSNPMVAIQHDSDLSKIADNSKFNSIISHEWMTFNEKYKPSYDARVDAFLFIGTNKPVKISDAKSGLIRRLIDVHPSGRKVPPRRYQTLISQIDFELGAIAQHCLDVYREMGRDYYAGYVPIEMMLQTDAFFNFIEDSYDVFKHQDGATLNQAWEMYKLWSEDARLEYKLTKLRFRDELRNYFDNFDERFMMNGERLRSWYSGFKTDQFKVQIKDEPVFSLVLDEVESILSIDLADAPAQLAAGKNGIPAKKWDEVDTKLSDIDTHELHYVRPPDNHIVIDFDLKGDDGSKSAGRNLEEANKWPTTYAEYSKSGSGIHLHYIYDGDPNELSRIFAPDIEIKVFTGHSSLRRKLSKCNNIPVAHISSGLPLKEKKVINSEAIQSEKSLRDLIERNLRKEIHPGTKPSMDFIHKILEDAYKSGLTYDVSNLKPKMLAFANNSSNQALYCLKLLQSMKFASDDSSATEAVPNLDAFVADDRIAFYDVEVFPNLFIICWKYIGSSEVVRMINPTAQQVEEFLKLKLVGFNCRRYDNHIVYAAALGYTVEQLYQLSQKIISNDRSAGFGNAYNLSYADIFDYSSKKQSLKKFQIELGIRHLELGLPWDEPVDPALWEKVAEYCDNDVLATEAVFEAREDDLVARQILSDLSGLPVNDTTQRHTAKIIFGDDRNPQKSFIYTDLSKGSKDYPIAFEGYKYDFGKSTYRDEVVGEGGYVYAEPGMYEDVAVLDVASMHPTSIENLNLFGDIYTKNFSALKKARVAIKRKDYDSARKMLGGILEPYLKNEDNAEKLSYALKIVINIVYGLTSAKFDNPFRDKRNKDNIVAKVGALFMIDLKHAVQEQGFQVVHIKTDSIKIPNATKEIIDFVMEFGEKYGYEFEHEATYSKFCLVNDAVYVARTTPGKKPAYWETTGAQFQHPYVRKFLFTKEPIEFADMCETKSVTTALYLDYNEDVSEDDTPMALDDTTEAESESKTLQFVGKAGSFCPLVPGAGGGLLLRKKDEKFYAATGTKGYRWMESEMVEELGKEGDIDLSYFRNLVDAAIDNINKYGDFETFVGEADAQSIAA